MGFPKQEYWSGLPFPSPEYLPWSRDRTCISCIGRQILYPWATREASLLKCIRSEVCFHASVEAFLWKLFSKSKVLHLSVSGQIEGRGSASVTRLQKLTLLCYRTWANGAGGCGGCHACDYTFWNSDPPGRFPEQSKQWTWKKWNNVVWLRLHEKGLKPSMEFIGFLFLSYFLFPSRDLLLCCKIIEVHWMFADAKIWKVSKAELQGKLWLIKHSKWDF